MAQQSRIIGLFLIALCMTSVIGPKNRPMTGDTGEWEGVSGILRKTDVSLTGNQVHVWQRSKNL